MNIFPRYKTRNEIKIVQIIHYTCRYSLLLFAHLSFVPLRKERYNIQWGRVLLVYSATGHPRSWKIAHWHKSQARLYGNLDVGQFRCQ